MNVVGGYANNVLDDFSGAFFPPPPQVNLSNTVVNIGCVNVRRSLLCKVPEVYSLFVKHSLSALVLSETHTPRSGLAALSCLVSKHNWFLVGDAVLGIDGAV
jgi:hypothetical protein